MPRFLLDTDICSYLMKRVNENVLRRAESVLVADLCTSSIVLCELELGVELSPRQERDKSALKDLLLTVAVLDYPGEAAIEYARIRAHLKTRGTQIGANDMLIAAHARHLGLTLVTNNTREFARVPGLKIENWADPSV